MIGLVRHAQAVKNVQGDIVGGLGSSLTLVGREQAARLGTTLVQACKWDVVYCSEQPQCQETLEIIGSVVRARRAPLAIPKYHLGLIEGLSSNLLESEYPDVAARFSRWRAGEISIGELAIPGADDPEEYYKKGLDFVSTLAPDRHTLVVSTRSVLVLLANVILKRTPRAGHYREVEWQPCQLRIFDNEGAPCLDRRHDE